MLVCKLPVITCELPVLVCELLGRRRQGQTWRREDGRGSVAGEEEEGREEAARGESGERGGEEAARGESGERGGEEGRGVKREGRREKGGERHGEG